MYDISPLHTFPLSSRSLISLLRHILFSLAILTPLVAAERPITNIELLQSDNDLFPRVLSGLFIDISKTYIAIEIDGSQHVLDRTTVKSFSLEDNSVCLELATVEADRPERLSLENPRFRESGVQGLSTRRTGHEYIPYSMIKKLCMKGSARSNDLDLFVTTRKNQPTEHNPGALYEH